MKKKENKDFKKELEEYIEKNKIKSNYEKIRFLKHFNPTKNF